MKRLFKKIVFCTSLTMCMAIFSGKAEAQGFCYDRGGWVSLGGTDYFVCPMGGAYEACAYPCRKT